MDRTRMIIERYESRRLYDTENCRYMDLNEVADIVRGGREVQIIDVESGKDVTSAVFAQIIMETAKSPDAGFPMDMVRQVIMGAGQLSPEVASHYIQAMTAAYQATLRSFAPQVNPFSYVQNMISMALRPIAGMGSGFAAGNAGAAPDLDELRRKLEEMESELGEQRTARPARKRKTSRPRSKS